jgi:hypothetical protein
MFDWEFNCWKIYSRRFSFLIKIVWVSERKNTFFLVYAKALSQKVTKEAQNEKWRRNNLWGSDSSQLRLILVKKISAIDLIKALALLLSPSYIHWERVISNKKKVLYVNLHKIEEEVCDTSSNKMKEIRREKCKCTWEKLLFKWCFTR